MNTTPAIRFEGFADPWEQRKLGEIGSIERGKRFTPADYVTADGIPCIHYGQIYTVYGPVATEAISQLRRDMAGQLHFAKPGDILLAGTSEDPDTVCKAVAWMGKTQVAYHDDSFAFSSNQDSLFLTSYFQSEAFRAQKDSVVYGVTVKRMNADALAKADIGLPSSKEQMAIGALFDNLDNLITLHQRKHDRLVVLKKALLDKMFPRDGSRFPELRFGGFTDPWEQRKFSEVFSFLRNNTLSRAELSDSEGETRDVHYGDILIKFGEVIDVRRDELPRIASDALAGRLSCQPLSNGDVIIADTAEDEAVGKCSELRGCSDYPIVSGLHTMACRPEFEFAPGYLGYYMNSPAFHDQLLPLMQGIKVISVSKGAISDTDVRFPSLPEQKAIGASLTELDNLITLHQRKLELLRNLKSACLDKMFV